LPLAIALGACAPRVSSNEAATRIDIAPTTPGIKRAIIDRADIDSVLALKLDSTLKSRERQPIPAGESWFPVMPAAPSIFRSR
jgi:hypothetical protein